MAVRFSHKVYCMHHAINNIDADLIIWLDADSFTFAPIPLKFLHKLTDKDTYCTYIGRPGNEGNKARKWSECGFMAYNTNHPENINFRSIDMKIAQGGRITNKNEIDKFLMMDGLNW